MLYKKTTILPVLILLIFQMQLQACSTPDDYTVDVSTFSAGDDSACVVKIKDIEYPEHPPRIIDTLYPSQLFSRLKTAYDTNKFVVIAHISEIKKFYPDPLITDSANYLTEIVTITIDSVLKGNMIQRQKIINHRLDCIERYLIYNSITNTYDTLQQFYFMKGQPYQTIIDKRFLIFAQEENQCFNLPLPPQCSFNTYGYVINNDQIYFDGTYIDFSIRKVINIPFLKIDYTHFVNNIRPVSIRKAIKIPEKYNTAGQPISAFDILGNRIPLTEINKHGSSLLLITPQGERTQSTKRIFLNN